MWVNKLRIDLISFCNEAQFLYISYFIENSFHVKMLFVAMHNKHDYEYLYTGLKSLSICTGGHPSSST